MPQNKCKWEAAIFGTQESQLLQTEIRALYLGQPWESKVMELRQVASMCQKDITWEFTSLIKPAEDGSRPMVSVRTQLVGAQVLAFGLPEQIRTLTWTVILSSWLSQMSMPSQTNSKMEQSGLMSPLSMVSMRTLSWNTERSIDWSPFLSSNLDLRIKIKSNKNLRKWFLCNEYFSYRIWFKN